MAKITQADVDAVKLNIENNWDTLHPTELNRLSGILKAWGSIKNISEEGSTLPTLPTAGVDYFTDTTWALNYVSTTPREIIPDDDSVIPDAYYDVYINVTTSGSNHLLIMSDGLGGERRAFFGGIEGETSHNWIWHGVRMMQGATISSGTGDTDLLYLTITLVKSAHIV